MRAEQQVLEKQQLDEQSRAANETLFKKKQLLAQIDKEFEEDSKRMEELQRQQNGMLQARGRAEEMRQMADLETADLQDQLDRVTAERAQLEARARSQGLLEPSEGFSKSLVEVDLGVRAVRAHVLVFIQTVQNCVRDQPRVLEQFRSLCESKGLPVDADFADM